jgi:hypothetical protein
MTHVIRSVKSGGTSSWQTKNKRKCRKPPLSPTNRRKRHRKRKRQLNSALAFLSKKSEFCSVTLVDSKILPGALFFMPTGVATGSKPFFLS